ncbi:MAG: hypothetical protein ACYTG7_16290, partial [Planctomycetota bacterium]
MKEIYSEGNHDFFYVSLVDNKCTKAHQRLNQYNLAGFPTVFFDGGYRVKVGAGSTSQAKTAYMNRINQCNIRASEDIDVMVSVQWLGDAVLDVTVRVKNYEAQTYGGTVRAYICERVSSLNWKDSAGKNYEFPFLDYAFTTPVSIPAIDVWEHSVVWDGKLKNSGHGHSYANIQHDNIVVIVAVFNDEKHQGYANPPNGNPFNAYYVDNTGAAMPAALIPDTTTVPEGGGTVNFDLFAGELSPNRNYIIIGSTSGTTPGFPLPGGLKLPVNWDWFSDLEMTLINTGIFSNFMGTLDAAGLGTAQLN